MTCSTACMSRATLALLVLVAGFAVHSSVASAHTQKVRDQMGDAKFGAKSGDIGRVFRQRVSLKAPKSVSVGKKMTLRIQGFPPNSAVSFMAALHGPAALSARRLGQTRTDSSGRATFRMRFPSTYQWCDADRKCSTYRWRPPARIALLAATKEAPYTSARKVVPLKKGGKRNRNRGPKPLTIPTTARKAIFRAVCPPGKRCEAKVSIKVGKRTYARGGYSVPAGKSRKVRLDLAKAGRKLSHSNRAKAKATITDKRTGKSKSFPVILRRRG